MVKVYYPWQISLIWIHFWTLLLNFGKNMYLTWITSPGEKDEESSKLGTLYSGKFGHSGRFAPLPCTVYLVINFVPMPETWSQ